MGKPSAPPAPDYQGAAREQGQASIEAARVQGQINNPNVINPYGTQTVTWSGDQPTLTQTFSPAQQALYDLSVQNQQGLGNLANQGIGTAQGILGTKIDLSGAPPMPVDSETLRSQMVDAAMGRVNQDYGIQQDQLRSDLVAAGIPVGSKAYDNQMQLLQRGVNDARQQAILNAGTAAQQAYWMDLQSRQQALSELLAKRQTPLNEITAMMSGSQVSNPFSVPGYAQNTSVAPAPMYQATSDLANFNTGLYNQKMGMYGNTMSGLFGLGGAGLMAMGMGSRGGAGGSSSGGSGGGGGGA